MSVVAATGHRLAKLGGYSDEVYQDLVRLAVESIPKNTERVISGMAIGWDQAVAEAAIAKGIPLVAAVPFIGQEKIWPTNSQKKYLDILDRADKIEVVSDGGYAAWKLAQRNIYMVGNCGLLLALWDGSSGGTMNCIKYCEKSFPRKPIINLWEKWRELRSTKS